MKLTHLDNHGKANMVDVGNKPEQVRIAIAEGFINLNDETVNLIRENGMKKGDVLTVSEIAGIQAAKRTSDLIPLCHPLRIVKIAVKASLHAKGVHIRAEVKSIGQTGVEMEALTAVNVALLNIYDMCKAVDKNMMMENIRLIEKTKTDI
ncbi:MAG: cyclic pyranopterin monophosphate synthase MoaC [Bacteroidetes bacterium]|nr:MAG: cyclic pyranopterin monophosphate synthase MoaC [Bacteroidota bacterium]